MNWKARLIRRIRRRRYERKIAHVPQGDDVHPVLDIGCSRFPVPGADFAGDYLPCEADTPEMRERLAGRFVRCDVHHLPFCEHAFGFVHCSNVFEHLDDPAQAFAELKRVARHGFIESPNAFRERVIVHPDNHSWIISWQDETIHYVTPTQVRIAGVQILPCPLSLVIKRRLPFVWKCFMYALDQVLGIAYNTYRW